VNVRSTIWLESTFQDVRLAVRGLRKNPGFGIAAIGTLALGIGANTAIFSVVNAVLLKPLPYLHASLLVSVTEFYPKIGISRVLTPEYAAWRKQKTRFAQLEAFGITAGMNLSGNGRSAERAQVAHVTPGFFSMLGMQPQIGRTFANDEDQPGHSPVIISDAIWRDYFQADPRVLGKSVVLDGNQHSVIGVMPTGFVSPDGIDTGLWLPDAVVPAATIPGVATGAVSVIGRLTPHVSLEQLRAYLQVIARNMNGRYPPSWSAYHSTAQVVVVDLQEQLTRGSTKALYILIVITGFVLLIACANIANLFVARAITRQREIAVRAAVGASRSRLVRFLFLESAVVGAIGACIGFIPAVSGVPALGFLAPRPSFEDFSVDGYVLAFTAACAMVAIVLFGLAPAVAGSRKDLYDSLRGSGSSVASEPVATFLRSALVVVQLAGCFMLLIGAGLLIRSFLLALSINPGFDAHNVLVGDVSLAPVSTYTPARQLAFLNRVLNAAKELPGVEFAGASTGTPLKPFNEIVSGLRVDGEPASEAPVVLTSANGDYFRALRIPIIKGRFFDDRDRDRSEPVAVVNETLAHILFGKHDPIGRRIQIGDSKEAAVTIVGVVGDIRHRALEGMVWPELVRPYSQAPSHWVSIVIRSSAASSNLPEALRMAVRAVDRNQPLFNVEFLEHRVSSSLAERRQRASLVAAFSFVAFAIALIGTYGLMVYSANRRIHELGVRLALGAEGKHLVRLLMGQGMRTAFAGLGIGLLGAFALSRTLSSFLFGITPTDYRTFAFVCIALVISICAANFIPARRAMKIDPMVTLRSE